MELPIDDDDNFDNTNDLLIHFPADVQNAIEQILSSNDPLDQPDFNTIDYINYLFPTEQSLSNIDDTVSKMEEKIFTIDNEISVVVRGQTTASQDGRQALDEAQRVIKDLFVQIKDIKEKAEKSEEMVREITHDIKQLDCAKRNLTLAITTLNHLHMLVGGVDTLKSLTEKRLYGEIALPLQAISEVMLHFESYTDIPQIKALSDQVKAIHTDLAQQITHDFKEAFVGTNAKNFIPNKQLSSACLVVSALEPRVKRDLLKWFIDLQLQEYVHLFEETEDTAWLDKIDKRYAWLKRHLIEFEDRLGSMFPQNWEVSERIAIQFCNITREELPKIMTKRKHEVDVKLLLYAIQKTTNFENLLARRFTGVTMREVEKGGKDSDGNVFVGLIGRCFIPFLYIYIESIDRNLADLIERVQSDDKKNIMTEATDTQASVLPSCGDLFVFYKKSMVQCTQLSKGQIMLDLTKTFQKYLREYAIKILQNNLPKIETQSLGSSVQSITRDLQKMSTSGLIQNFSSLLKEGEITRFTSEELKKICCILTTAEYCLETTQQLAQKLREKTDSSLSEQINLSQEESIFHSVISNCIQILVQDLENSCEPALTAMSKIQWQNIDSVGDQSPYVTSISTHFKTTVPIIRDHLSHSRKYFTQFCIKFANLFIPKFTNNIYKCKPINTEGAEQLLLDTHMLKMVLLNLPLIASQINRQAPATYTKAVNKGMTKAEMILKVVMTPIEPSKAFVEQYMKLLPECQLPELSKILEMKNVKKQEQTYLLEIYRAQKPGTEKEAVDDDVLVQEGGRIKKLEKLIKKGLPK
ncbi:hypothetical protein FQA39_LY14323 [Lamprigera yunnana]|nr:hypothetical protein FQA39_LY14323 [Lamprigera yunnana]